MATELVVVLVSEEREGMCVCVCWEGRVSGSSKIHTLLGGPLRAFAVLDRGK